MAFGGGGNPDEAKTFFRNEMTNTDFALSEDFFADDVLLLKERIRDKDFIIHFNEQRIVDLKNELDRFKNRIKSHVWKQVRNSKRKTNRTDCDDEESGANVFADILKLSGATDLSEADQLECVKELLLDSAEMRENSATERRLDEATALIERLNRNQEKALEIIDKLKGNEKRLQSTIDQLLLLRHKEKIEVSDFSGDTESLSNHEYGSEFVDNCLYPKRTVLGLIVTLLRFI